MPSENASSYKTQVAARRIINKLNGKPRQYRKALSILRKRQIDRMQDSETNSQMQVNLLYLNVLQESQQMLSNMRHQLRAAKKFME